MPAPQQRGFCMIFRKTTVFAFASAALSHNIKITPGPAFNFGPNAKDHAVRICFGQPATAHDLKLTLLKIRDLMEQDPEDDFTPVA